MGPIEVQSIRFFPERIRPKGLAISFERIQGILERNRLFQAIRRVAGLRFRTANKLMSPDPSQGVPFSALASGLAPYRSSAASSERSEGTSRRFVSPAATILICAVRLYQLIVPKRVKPKCLYTPTCSQFAIEALRLYGFIGGIRASVGRLGRCNGALYAPGEDYP
jgi:hypothetical protein